MSRPQMIDRHVINPVQLLSKIFVIIACFILLNIKLQIHPENVFPKHLQMFSTLLGSAR